MMLPPMRVQESSEGFYIFSLKTFFVFPGSVAQHGALAFLSTAFFRGRDKRMLL